MDCAAEYGSHSVRSDRQARRASETRTPEARKPLRYAGAGGHNHCHASRLRRRPWIR